MTLAQMAHYLTAAGPRSGVVRMDPQTVRRYCSLAQGREAVEPRKTTEIPDRDLSGLRSGPRILQSDHASSLPEASNAAAQSPKAENSAAEIHKVSVGPRSPRGARLQGLLAPADELRSTGAGGEQGVQAIRRGRDTPRVGLPETDDPWATTAAQLGDPAMARRLDDLARRIEQLAAGLTTRPRRHEFTAESTVFEK